jgi:hypothetical protein
MARPRTAGETAEEIGRLAGLSRSELAERWQAIFGSVPPKGVKRGLLERACAYDIQAKAFGGLRRPTKKSLAAVADGGALKAPPSKLGLKPGSHLLREWHGVVHRAEVTHDGILWNGRRYRSLSAVARAITGTSWSGPRFFGL